MKVIIGSNNLPKRLAVERAFNGVYPDTYILISTVSADSGVSSHPLSGTESLTGALNRAASARILDPDADFYVGIEGGLLIVDDRVWEIGWVAIVNAKGETYTGISAGIELRGEFLKAIRSGKELNDVLSENCNIDNAGGTNGFYGLATDDLVTREQAYVQAVVFALAPFKHPEYFS